VKASTTHLHSFGEHLRTWTTANSSRPELCNEVDQVIASLPTSHDFTRTASGGSLALVWQLDSTSIRWLEEGNITLAIAGWKDALTITSVLVSDNILGGNLIEATILSHLGSLQIECGEVVAASRTLQQAHLAWSKIEDVAITSEYEKIRVSVGLAIVRRDFGDLNSAVVALEACARRLRNGLTTDKAPDFRHLLIDTLCLQSTSVLTDAALKPGGERSSKFLALIRPDLAAKADQYENDARRHILNRAEGWAQEALNLCNSECVPRHLLKSINAWATVRLQKSEYADVASALKAALATSSTFAPHSGPDRMALARTYSILAVALAGQCEWSESFHCNKIAAGLFAGLSEPLIETAHYAACLVNLGEQLLSFDANRYPELRLEAHSVLRKAVNLVELARSVKHDAHAKHSLLCEFVRGYDLLVGSCILRYKAEGSRDYLHEAIATYELTRARHLSEGLDIQSLRHRLFCERIRWAENAKAKALFEQLLSRTTDSAALKEHEQWSKIVRFHELDSRHATREEYRHSPLGPINYSNIHKPTTDSDTAVLIEYAFVDNEGVAFCISPAGIDFVSLPSFTERNMSALAFLWNSVQMFSNDGGHFGDHLTEEQSKERACTEISKALSVFSSDINERLLMLLEEFQRPGWTLGAFIDESMTIVAEHALTPLVRSGLLNGVSSLIFVPCGALHSFPLHVCPMAGEQRMHERFTISYAPSLHTYSHSRLSRPLGGPRVLVLEDPTDELPLAGVESDLILHLFSESRRWRGAAIYKERVLQDSDDVDILHYLGHAGFSLSDPQSSALVLEGHNSHTRWLTAGEISAGAIFKRKPLVVLSGCETGKVMMNDLDSQDSLALSFLLAGASTVVASLWKVHDVAAAVIVGRMYQNLVSGSNIGSALAEAQSWLRRSLASKEIIEHLLLEDPDSPLSNWRSLGSDQKSKLENAVRDFAEKAPRGPTEFWAPYVVIGNPGFRCRKND
jgi:CHAT domain-containing protein